MTDSPQDRYMQAALEEARKAYRIGETPVGAVVVNRSSGAVIAAGHNETIMHCDPTAHAEMVALRKAGRVVHSPRLPDCDIYVTLEPCPMCAQAISFARIGRLYFGAYDVKGGGVEHGAHIYRQKSCFHAPEVYGGLQETTCAALLTDFFKTLRGPV